ncbi:MAG: glycosyltransferase family 9 protein, partial [Nitrospirae bacterium]|nr:glycosyltransferase family 9 protein [Nitrospirota bacterium]
PFGAKKYKNWPVEHVISLVKTLHLKYNSEVILFGGRKEMPVGAGIAGELKDGFIDLTGRTNIRETSALIKICRLFISTDSGPMHLSQAVGTPTIALFGPTDPAIYGPRGERHILIRKSLVCSPCKYYDCPDAQCMSLIMPDDVCKAVDEMLGKGWINLDRKI